MRRTDIRSIHSLTTFNATRYIFDHSTNDETRRLALLQTAAFTPLFRGTLAKDAQLDRIEPQKATIEEIFVDVSRDKPAASRKVLGYLQGGGEAKTLAAEARRLIFTKAMDAHDYKFSSAVLEDYYNVSPTWRDRYLASNAFNLNTATEPDNDLVQRTRAAFNA